MKQDWVPGADGLPNPDTRDRVTVTLTNPLAVPPTGWTRAWARATDWSNYADGARAVAASRDPSLQASTAALAAVVGAGGAATVTRFSLRARGPAAHPADRAAPGPRPPSRGSRAGPDAA